MQPRRIRFWSALISVLAAGLCLQQPARANIYGFTAGDGTVYLSNMQVDDRYQVVVRAPVDAVAAEVAPLIAQKVQYDQIVAEVARIYGLDSALLHAVISVESSYRSNAVSGKGAVGLMQLMPVLARHYGVADPLDPVQNLHGGAKHLRHLLKRYNNDISLTLAAYNSGETAVAKHGRRIPPFRETTNYVPRVLGFYRKYRKGLL